MAVTGKLVGLDVLDRKLARLASLVGRKPSEERLIRGGEIIAETARRLVHRRSGNLADSIQVSAAPANAAWGSSSLMDGDLVVYIGPKSGGGNPDGFYGHMEEFGTIDTPAHPFMRPAFDSQGEAAVDRVVSSLRVDANRLLRE